MYALFSDKSVGKVFIYSFNCYFCSLDIYLYPCCFCEADRTGLTDEAVGQSDREAGNCGSSGLLHRIHADNDTVYKREYKELYGAFRYVAGQRSEAYMMAHYGVDGAFDLRKKIIPGSLIIM